MKGFLLALLVFLAYAHSSECVVRKIEVSGDIDERFGEIYLNGLCVTLVQALRDTVDALAENGYPFAKSAYAMDSSGFARVLIERGNAWVWAAAENRETSKSRKETFARLSGLVAGSLVRLSDLGRAERKLIRTGYFESTAAPKLYRDSVRNRLFPVFSMRDLSVSSVEGFATYASGENGGFSGNIELFLYNMRGTGRDLSVSGNSGDWERSVSASYKEPWLLGSGWNGILRGSFEEDSTYRAALLEAGLSRSVGFLFEFAVLGGVGNDRLTYALETEFKNVDRTILPRHGQILLGVFRLTRERSDSSRAFVTELRASGEFFTPIARTLVLHSSFSLGTLLPTNRHFGRRFLFSLGGLENLKGYRPGFFRTRAYGISELDLQWRMMENLALHGFLEPGLHRAASPAHGWSDTYSYGIGFSQYRGSWSFSLFYALHRGTDALGGLLHFGVKALF